MPETAFNLFEWTAQYAVRVPAIDREHQKLFRMGQRLHEFMLGGSGKQALDQLLTELIVYTQAHFAREERLMRRIQYPDFERHCRLHNELRRTVLAFQDRFSNGEVTITIHMMQFLSRWLKQHTSGVDRRIGQFLEKAGRIQAEPSPQSPSIA